MVVLVLIAFVAQAALMFVDERTYHRRRGLPRWERIGHPLDTITVLACYTWLVATRPTTAHAIVYVALAMASSAFVTKDERLHAERCSPGEHWIHALLFVVHPFVLLGAGWLWWTQRFLPLLFVQLATTAAVGMYQLLYWNVWNRPWQRAQ